MTLASPDIGVVSRCAGAAGQARRPGKGYVPRLPITGGPANLGPPGPAIAQTIPGRPEAVFHNVMAAPAGVIRAAGAARPGRPPWPGLRASRRSAFHTGTAHRPGWCEGISTEGIM